MCFTLISLSDSLFSLKILHPHRPYDFSHLSISSSFIRFLLNNYLPRVNLGKYSELIRSGAVCLLAITEILDSLGLNKKFQNLLLFFSGN